MGLISLPSLDDYWSTDPILSDDWFRTVFSCNHFHQILQYMHVADNTKALDRSNPNYDKLWKVRPLLDVLSKQSIELYAPHQQLSTNESMIGTNCPLSFIHAQETHKMRHKGLGVGRWRHGHLHFQCILWSKFFSAFTSKRLGIWCCYEAIRAMLA